MSDIADKYNKMLEDIRLNPDEYVDLSGLNAEYDKEAVSFSASGSTGFIGLLQKAIEGIGLPIATALRTTLDGLVDKSTKVAHKYMELRLQEYKDSGYITEASGNRLLKLVTDQGFLSPQLVIIITLILEFNKIKAEIEPARLFATQEANLNHRPSIPQPESVIRAMFIAPEYSGRTQTVLAKHGYTDKDIELLKVAQYATYDYKEIFALRLRGEIDDAKLYERMRENGFTDARTNELFKLTKVIPPIQDIITMSAREAFEPGMVSLMGLDDEFPPEMQEHGEKQGLTPYWQHKYWQAHWQQPSMNQILAMLHRGIISEEEVYEFMKVIEIPPYWRDNLTKINYLPYTRVDVRRMHDIGVLKDEELVSAYMDLGFDEEHAIGMTEFTLKYNNGNDKDLTRAQIEKAYKAGVIDRPSALALIQDLGYTETKARFIITLVDYAEMEESRDNTINVVRDKYKSNLITEEDARSTLNKLDLTSKKINDYIALWETARYKARRKITKEQADKFLLNGIIGIEEYVDELRILGYSTKYINWFVQLIAQQI